MESEIYHAQRKTPKAGFGVVPDDAACLDYIDWIRRKDGSECPSCHSSREFAVPPSPRNKAPSDHPDYMHARATIAVQFDNAGVGRRMIAAMSRIKKTYVRTVERALVADEEIPPQPTVTVGWGMLFLSVVLVVALGISACNVFPSLSQLAINYR